MPRPPAERLASISLQQGEGGARAARDDARHRPLAEPDARRAPSGAVSCAMRRRGRRAGCGRDMRGALLRGARVGAPRPYGQCVPAGREPAGS